MKLKKRSKRKNVEKGKRKKLPRRNLRHHKALRHEGLHYTQCGPREHRQLRGMAQLRGDAIHLTRVGQAHLYHSFKTINR